MTIIQYLASPFWGGGEQFVYSLAKQLVERYHHTLIFICQPNTDKRVQERFRAIGQTITLKPTTKNGKFSFQTAYQLSQIIDKNNAHVLHVHEMKDYFVCAYAKILCHKNLRLIGTVHIIRPAKNKSSWRWAYRQFDKITFVSNLAKDTFLFSLKNTKNNISTQVIHNSIASSSVLSSSTDIYSRYRVTPKDVIILYHGRVCAEKGILQLLPHLRDLMHLPIQIFIAGFGNETDIDYIQRLSAEVPFKGKVHYIGFQYDMSPFLVHADIGLVPSIVPEAGGPLALLEHLQAGNPVISSDNGSQPEYITHGEEGFLCKPMDYAHWKDYIQQLVEDDALRAEMAIKARQRFQKAFSYTLLLNKIVALYE